MKPEAVISSGPRSGPWFAGDELDCDSARAHTRFCGFMGKGFDRGSGSECRVESGRLVSDRIVRVLGD